jgi:hypothetical protein
MDLKALHCLKSRFPSGVFPDGSVSGKLYVWGDIVFCLASPDKKRFQAKSLARLLAYVELPSEAMRVG